MLPARRPRILLQILRSLHPQRGTKSFLNTGSKRHYAQVQGKPLTRSWAVGVFCALAGGAITYVLTAKQLEVSKGRGPGPSFASRQAMLVVSVSCL